MLKYIEAMQEINDDHVDYVVKQIISAVKSDKRIYIVGNGGSLSIAEHMVSDIVKGASHNILEKAINILCPGSNQVELTADMNDNGTEVTLLNPIKRRGIDEGDLILSFSVSGTSPNIVALKEWCAEQGAKLISFVGKEIDKLPFEYVVLVNHKSEGTARYAVSEVMFSCFAHEIAFRVRSILDE
jgi:D-sedoheptulose 7-phosphate isomerase